MASLRYAGIGARATPANVLADMTVMAGWLARTGWHLSSGGAEGADSAFAAGSAGRAADGLAAVAGLQRASRAGLPGAVPVGAGVLGRTELGINQPVAHPVCGPTNKRPRNPALAVWPQASLAQSRRTVGQCSHIGTTARRSVLCS